jgi:hypothetical protein
MDSNALKRHRAGTRDPDRPLGRYGNQNIYFHHENKMRHLLYISLLLQGKGA